MVPDVLSIVRKRYRIQRTLRLVNLTFFLIFLLWSSARTFDWVFGESFFLHGRIESFGLLFKELPWTWMVGCAFLWIFERRLVRWLQPLPRALCPECSYMIAGLTNPKCPECGLLLPDELVVAPAVRSV